MGNKTSRKKGGKTKSQSRKKPTLTSQTAHQDSVTSAAQPAKTEEDFQASRRTPSLSATNEDPSEEESVTVEDTAEPQTLEDKKQILINALKKKYKVQYNGVKPIPYIQERLYCVDNVFVESGVNASIGGAASYDKAIQWVRLKSYKNIFTDSRMRSNRRIVEGEPGYGKSTLTLQLAYDWCNGVPDSPLYDVEILILLKLRQMGNVTSIYKAIKLYLYLTKEESR
ncbi:hypothetical protein BSL78_19688 [Apostichopus japonicus]|uniref:NLR family CARD domain-containing protein 4 n=1 Tax=Stichopus japonicus TaxID=307972 RepID=A0A2G8K668_STIJA|nr:hypothetical protein BSL78_19688 [Apostichopus japonicus]